jgi:hypothetical protein
MDVDDRKTEQTVDEGRSKGEKGAQGIGSGKALRSTPGRRERNCRTTGLGGKTIEVTQQAANQEFPPLAASEGEENQLSQGLRVNKKQRTHVV